MLELFYCYYLLSGFFCFFRIDFSKKLYENQEAFSERSFLLSGVLQGLAKICKKIMEVNYFSLLSCTIEK